MPKKVPPSGFVPIPFKLSGRILSPISVVLILIGVVGFFTGWIGVAWAIFLLGIALLLLSLYLRFIVPKE